MALGKVSNFYAHSHPDFPDDTGHWEPFKERRKSSEYIAHIRQCDSTVQTLEEHLNETSKLAMLFACKLGLEECGKLIGLIHDLGKYSEKFQGYIADACGLNGEEAKERASKLQGKIDHATSGAQHIWNKIGQSSQLNGILAQILSAAVISHHSRTGIKDFVDLNGKSPFLNRLSKCDADTGLSECLRKAEPNILKEIDEILESDRIRDDLRKICYRIKATTGPGTTRKVEFALLTRFLFSCLLDADRISTIDFENPKSADFRSGDDAPKWGILREKLEEHLLKFENTTDIDAIRSRISDNCRDAANRPDNLLCLQVPTGGGKTLASLRFALHRAASKLEHRIDRIIYILPYTSILDQNAQTVREILGDECVLEHHSNLSEEKDTWRNRVLSENWDAPVVFTTTVQFLNALFAAGTKSARRMHQLTGAILIFDEIQSLPIKTVHLFNNALQFLTKCGNTTAVLCTATMPLLQKVCAKSGALPISKESNILQKQSEAFKQLKRTEVRNNCRLKGWSYQEAVDFALEQQAEHRSLLIVCNTKKCAQDLFNLLKQKAEAPVIHLSTNMCPAHRKYRIRQLREKLSPEKSDPVICVSTQLIEAGVDLDFGCVIRSLAGLDSIIQAAGRCNRNGHRKTGKVHVLNLNEEKLVAGLKEMKLGQQITHDRIFQEFADHPEHFDHDLLSEKATSRYYEYYFHQRAAEMTYPLPAGRGNPPLAQGCSLLSLLSTNQEGYSEAKRIQNKEALRLPLRQAHSTASQSFQVIDAPTLGVIVPYDKDGYCGSKIIGELAACYTNESISLAHQICLHKQAQQYTVNVFSHRIEKLQATGALREIHLGEGIYHLDERYYHEDLGITFKALSEQKDLIVHG